MKPVRRTFLIASAIAVLALSVRSSAALEPSKDGWFHTGDAVRVKTIAFIEIKAYSVSHYVKVLPAKKSKRAVIELDADKRIAYRMLRDVGADKMKKMFRDAFADNGYTHTASIETFVGVFKTDLREGATTTVTYDAAKQATTISTAGGTTATIAGAAFMRATWSVWFGKMDQPTLGDALISKL
jgi:hypothetical protein